MNKKTIFALLTTIAILSNVSAAERPERPTASTADRPEINGSTTDEIAVRPERPKRPNVEKPEIERPEVPGEVTQAAAKVIKHTKAELDRIKEALKRLRENNRDLTDEQVERIKERLLERAKQVVRRAKSAKERIEELRDNLGNRDELLEKAKEKRDARQDEAKAKTSRDRE